MLEIFVEEFQILFVFFCAGFGGGEDVEGGVDGIEADGCEEEGGDYCCPARD